MVTKTTGDEEERASDASKDLVQEYAQAAMEVVLSDDVLARIPMVRSVMIVPKAISGIRDHLLMRKLDAFLRTFDDIPVADRRAMVGKLEADPAYGRRVGEHLIELLERLGSHRKPIMVGEVFAAYARGKIDINMLHRLIRVIERLPTMEIDTVRRFVNSAATRSVGIAYRDSHERIGQQRRLSLQPESRSKFVGESVIRLAYTRFLVQALDENQSFVLCEVREPRPHFASETLGFDRARFLFFEQCQQPGEVICIRGALLSGKCVLQ